MSRSGGRRRSGAARVRTLAQLTMLCPAAVVLVAVFGVPLCYSLFSSFQASGTNFGQLDWIGLAHYQTLLSERAFWRATLVSLIFTGGCVLLTYLAGLVLALLVYRRIPFARTVQVMSIVPWAMPYVAAAMIWANIFDYQYGPLNWVLRDLGLINENAGWLTSPQLALISVILVQVWKLFPLAAVMLLSGLQAIPAEQEEAAAVDGAGQWHTVQYVLLPGLRSVSTILTLLMTIWVFGRSFTVIYVLTGGGPADATSTLVLRTFAIGFQQFDTQAASALGTLVLVIAGLLTTLYWRFGLRRAEA